MSVIVHVEKKRPKEEEEDNSERCLPLRARMTGDEAVAIVRDIVWWRRE